MYMSPMVKAYLYCAIWSSVDIDTDEPLDQSFDVEDFTRDAVTEAEQACADFLEKAGGDADSISLSDLGHDFWLTRNRHGVGFWDRGLGEVGKRLTAVAKSFGESNVMIDNSNKLYFS